METLSEKIEHVNSWELDNQVHPSHDTEVLSVGFIKEFIKDIIFPLQKAIVEDININSQSLIDFIRKKAGKDLI